MAAGKSILILDDSEVVLEVARRYLTDAGYGVLTATNISEFDQIQKESNPDLILLDVQMPELNGDDIGNVLRNVRGIKVPIILFSTLEESELSRRAADAELDGWVSKNQGLDALVETVGKFLT